MRKYNINVIRTDEYEIEIDETVWTPKEIEDWAYNHSYSIPLLETTADLAEHLALEISNVGYYGLVDGFGYLKVFYASGRPVIQASYREIKESEYAKGISVKLIAFEDRFQTEINAVE